MVGEPSLRLWFKDELLKKPFLRQDAIQVMELFEDQESVTKRLKWSGINPGNFYYKSKRRKPSSTSLRTDGGIATNHEIVEEIKNILGIEFLCYDYKPVADELFDRGFIVNHKKVLPVNEGE